MNTFPLQQRPIVPFDLLQEDIVLRSEQSNGIVLKRLKFPSIREKTMGPFTWQYLSEDDYAELMRFYSENTAIPFDFTYHTKKTSVKKTVTFSGPPKRSYAGSIGWQVQCTFEEA